jgi:hypothetical protein
MWIMRPAIVIVCLLFLSLGQASPPCETATEVTSETPTGNDKIFGATDQEHGSYHLIIGIVKDGEFLPLESRQGFLGPVRLTSIRMIEARSPESGELNLEDYGGSVIMVWSQGSGGGWLYDAKIVDQAGPILTALALRIFGQDNQTAGG